MEGKAGAGGGEAVSPSGNRLNGGTTTVSVSTDKLNVIAEAKGGIGGTTGLNGTGTTGAGGNGGAEGLGNITGDSTQGKGGGSGGAGAGSY